MGHREEKSILITSARPSLALSYALPPTSRARYILIDYTQRIKVLQILSACCSALLVVFLNLGCVCHINIFSF